MIDGIISLKSDEANEPYYVLYLQTGMKRRGHSVAIRSCCDEWLGNGLGSAQYSSGLIESSGNFQGRYTV